MSQSVLYHYTATKIKSTQKTHRVGWEKSSAAANRFIKNDCGNTKNMSNMARFNPRKGPVDDKSGFVESILHRDKMKTNQKRFDHRIKRQTDHLSKELGIQKDWLF